MRRPFFGLVGALACGLALTACTSGSSTDAGPPPDTKACILAPACQGNGSDGGCGAESQCVAAPNLSCTMAVQCPPTTPGFICRDIPRCMQTCLADVCPPLDGGIVATVDGGRCLRLSDDCSGQPQAPHCVNGVCQACATDADCSGGTSCLDLNVQRGCNVASDCPGTVGQFVCE